MNIALKDFKKVVTFINKLFTDKEKEATYLSINKYDDVSVYVTYENSNNLVIGRKLPATDIEDGFSIKIRVNHFIQIPKSVEKGIDVITVSMSSDDENILIITDTIQTPICNIVGHPSTNRNLSSLLKMDNSYKVNNYLLTNVISSMQSVLKTNHFKDIEVSFNNIINVVLGKDIKFYANNGISLIYRNIEPLSSQLNNEFSGSIEAIDLGFVNKWIGSATGKELDFFVSDERITISNDEQFASFTYFIDKESNKLLGIYDGMLKTISTSKKIIKMDGEDFLNSINKRALKAETFFNLNDSLKSSILTENIEEGYSYCSSQIKNIVSSIDEEFEISLCECYRNPLLITFGSNGYGIVNRKVFKN